MMVCHSIESNSQWPKSKTDMADFPVYISTQRHPDGSRVEISNTCLIEILVIGKV